MSIFSAIQIFIRPLIKCYFTSFGLFFLFIGFLDAQVMETGYCAAYCTTTDQQRDPFYCPRLNDTLTSVYCCGTVVYKYCCSERREQAPLYPNTYCGDKIKYDWIIIVTIVMTVVIFLLGLIGCLCICHKKCGCKTVLCSETGEPHSVSETPAESAVHSTTASDFDPTSPCAFAPPAYDTLPKDPPIYSEIFTISAGCSGNSPSIQTRTSLPLESICNSENRCHHQPDNYDSIHAETRFCGSGQSVVDLNPPSYQSPPAVSAGPSPPSYSSSSPTRHRPSMSLAIELHPLSLGVSGSQLSSPAHVRVLPVAV